MPQQAEDISVIHQKLADGTSFEQSTHGYFSTQIASQIKVAEVHGELKLALTEMSQLLRLQMQQLKKIKALLRYPMALLGLLLILFVALKIWVFPAIAGLTPNGAAKSNQSVPTVWVLFGLVPVIVLVWVMFELLKRLDYLAKLRLLCRIPLIGHVVERYYQYQLLVNVVIMLKSGLRLQEVLASSKQYASKSFLFELGTQITSQLEAGETLLTIIQQEPLVPNELGVFIQKGETGAKLNEDLLVFSKMIYRELVERIEQLIQLIQPIMFAVIGFFIVLTYLSLLIPMYQTVGGMNY
ncbi:competence protein ComGB [Secundilactobacillus oryzae JCM 18671]|uniref:Competence protein ComGB n=2 Tax=Secundilactobacillus oryzae TaxID=1202668 RepID=A0A081BIZ6_9LACO|nr:competence protein ComGB [Secundilactobacillus oryzae JCM 18671]